MQNLAGVWAGGPADAWAVGAHGTILHWDGSVWTAKSSGTIVDLAGVWGNGAGDVWAVGQRQTILHYHQ
jgi:hypothetical protein